MGKEPTAILESEKMEHLLPSFAEQGITYDILTKLTDSDLKELGIHKLGDRKRLLAAFAYNIDLPLGGTVMITVGAGILPQDSELAGLHVEEFEIGKYPVMQDEWEWVRVWGLANDYELGAGQAKGSWHPITHMS